jgi:hypothetical protein
MTGIIQGGWEFVAAAYLVSAAVLGAYAVSVFARFRTAAAIEARNTAPKAGK